MVIRFSIVCGEALSKVSVIKQAISQMIPIALIISFKDKKINSFYLQRKKHKQYEMITYIQHSKSINM